MFPNICFYILRRIKSYNFSIPVYLIGEKFVGEKWRNFYFLWRNI